MFVDVHDNSAPASFKHHHSIIINHPHSTIIIQPSSFNHHHSIIIIQSSSFNHHHSIIIIQSSSFNHHHPIIIIQPSSFNHHLHHHHHHPVIVIIHIEHFLARLPGRSSLKRVCARERFSNIHNFCKLRSPFCRVIASSLLEFTTKYFWSLLAASDFDPFPFLYS